MLHVSGNEGSRDEDFVTSLSPPPLKRKLANALLGGGGREARPGLGAEATNTRPAGQGTLPNPSQVHYVTL